VIRSDVQDSRGEGGRESELRGGGNRRRVSDNIIITGTKFSVSGGGGGGTKNSDGVDKARDKEKRVRAARVIL